MVSRVKIGTIICKARKNFNYSQKEMAQKSGVNASTISEIENGHFTGSFDIFERLMNAVGLQFEVVAKKINCLIGMKLTCFLVRKINE